jgi:hypothetical protein
MGPEEIGRLTMHCALSLIGVTRRGWSCRPSNKPREVAEEMAKQIANDVEDEHFKNVVVKTAAGKVVHKTPIKPDSKR